MPFLTTISAGNLGAVGMKNNLKVYRAKHNLTQEQLAEKIGVSRQTVNAIESDKYLPSLGLAFKIAKLFQVKIEDIFIYD
jgi:putative transcriptional regulator